MKRRSYLFICVFCLIELFAAHQVLALTGSCYSKMSEVLGCFLQEDDGVSNCQFLSEDDSDPQVTIRSYVLYSQKWPLEEHSTIPTTVWRHRINFYVPKQVSHPTAFLYVTGGYNRSKEGMDKFFHTSEYVDYKNIALNDKIVVIELEDVPNQFLLMDSVLKKEDKIIAYTYRMVMDNPMQNAYLAGHLPMAKSIVKAMDASQKILKQEYGYNITKFILSGASKRGWAVWLAALEDTRVKAIIPIVINILNAQKSITHICRSYRGICPPALNDYKEEGIASKINTPVGTQLMQIEDPYSYLGSDYASKYKERLAIPKYIIAASGDDFFVPDSSRWYFKSLPGRNNYIRYLPNAMHYFKGNMISDSLNSLRYINESIRSYLYLLLNHEQMPQVQWQMFPNKIELTSSLKPQAVKLWVAHNQKERDFRLITSYSRFHLILKKIQQMIFGTIGDNRYQEKDIKFSCEAKKECRVAIPLPKLKRGWQASFVEVHYDIDKVPFVITSEIDITPDVMPPVVRHPDVISN